LEKVGEVAPGRQKLAMRPDTGNGGTAFRQPYRSRWRQWQRIPATPATSSPCPSGSRQRKPPARSASPNAHYAYTPSVDVWRADVSDKVAGRERLAARQAPGAIRAQQAAQREVAVELVKVGDAAAVVAVAAIDGGIRANGGARRQGDSVA
jgi:hypothetical protein